MIPHSFCSPELLAHILYEKYVMVVPLERQAKELKAMGMRSSTATLSNWVIYAAETFIEACLCQNETDTALEGGRSMIPKLDFTDAKLFYDLWIPLLDHVNQTYNVNSKLGKMTRADGLNIQEVRVVADFLWSHPAVIDGYLAFRRVAPGSP